MTVNNRNAQKRITELCLDSAIDLHFMFSGTSLLLSWLGWKKSDCRLCGRERWAGWYMRAETQLETQVLLSALLD